MGREASHFFKKVEGCTLHDGGPLGDIHDLATPCRDSPLIWRSTRRRERERKIMRMAIGGDGERAGRDEVGGEKRFGLI